MLAMLAIVVITAVFAIVAVAISRAAVESDRRRWCNGDGDTAEFSRESRARSDERRGVAGGVTSGAAS